MDRQNVGENMNCGHLKGIVSFCEAVDEEDQILLSERLRSIPVSNIDGWYMQTFYILCPGDSKDLSKEALFL